MLKLLNAMSNYIMNVKYNKWPNYARRIKTINNRKGYK